MYIPFEIGEKSFLVKPYITSQEKEILLLSSFNIDDLDRVLDILEYKSDFEIQDLSEEEKKVLLYKFREISLGDEVDIKFVCDKCKCPNENTLEANNFIVFSIRNDKDIKKINKKVTDENLQDFIIGDTNVDELDLQDFEELKKRIQENQIQYNFIKKTKCLRCGTERSFDLSSNKYIIDIMSDDTLMSLYKTYNNMVFFGHYSKDDIDKMLPFERTILLGLLQKTKEEIV